MATTLRPGTRCRRLHAVHFVGVSIVCSMLLSAAALAGPNQEHRDKPGDAKSGVDTPPGKDAKPQGKQGADAKDNKAKGGTRAKAFRKHKGASKDAKRITQKGGKRNFKFKMDPNAKWACANSTVTLEPVWRGDKKLTFEFDILNEGTADLKIKARGG